MSGKIESLSWEAYQATPGISNSMLKWMHPPYTPAHFRARYITGEITDEDTEAKRFGRLVHRLILEPDTMNGAFYVTPKTLDINVERLKKLKSAKVVSQTSDKATIEWNGTLSEADQWMREHSDRPVLSASDAQLAMRMRDAVWAHRGARALLTGARTETCVFATDEDGTQRKARVDVIPKSGNAIVDVKTVEQIDNESVERAIWSYHWFRQGAYYLDLLKMAGIQRQVFAFIFVEKNPPYLVTIRPLSVDAETLGRMLYRRDLALYRHCLAENHWPGDPFDGQDVSIPSWQMRKFEEVI